MHDADSAHLDGSLRPSLLQEIVTALHFIIDSQSKELDLLRAADTMHHCQELVNLRHLKSVPIADADGEQHQ